MKQLRRYLITLLPILLLGCRSTAPSTVRTDIPAWSQVRIGMPRQQVYGLMGKPLRETAQQADWKGPEAKMGWPSTTCWRKYEACFDENGRVKTLRDYDQQK